MPRFLLGKRDLITAINVFVPFGVLSFLTDQILGAQIPMVVVALGAMVLAALVGYAAGRFLEPEEVRTHSVFGVFFGLAVFTIWYLLNIPNG